MQKKKIPHDLIVCTRRYVLAECSQGLPESHAYTAERYAKQFQVEGYRTLLRRFDKKIYIYRTLKKDWRV